MKNTEIKQGQTYVLVATDSQARKHLEGKAFFVNEIKAVFRKKWVIKKEKEGYIFREITHGCGISGHHKTIRRLILRSSGVSHIKIIFEP